jgi:hypothetical protein
MLQKLEHIIPLQQTFQVVGIHFSKDEVRYTLLIIHKKKEEFTIGKRLETAAVAEIYKATQTKHPLLLHFSGDGILHKKVMRSVNYRQKLLFKANPDEFYFQELHQAEAIFVSFCRKKIIDEHIATFQAKKYHILDLGIGPFVTYSLRSFLTEKTIISHDIEMTFSATNLIDFIKEASSHEKEYTIEDISLNSREIALFALFVQYQIQEEQLSIDAPFVFQNRTDYTFFKATKAASIIGLLIVLALLLFGHFTLENYQANAAENKALIARVSEASAEVNLLIQEKKNKETIVATSGLFHPKFLTQYFYEIGNSVQKNIKLSGMNITPLVKKIRADKEVLFHKKEIHVEGITTNDADFNTWIAALTEKSWVQKVDIESYTQDRTRKKSFVIHIYF